MTKVGVLHENERISRRFWRKLIRLMSIWANYTVPNDNENNNRISKFGDPSLSLSLECVHFGQALAYLRGDRFIYLYCWRETRRALVKSDPLYTLHNFRHLKCSLPFAKRKEKDSKANKHESTISVRLGFILCFFFVVVFSFCF